MIPPFSLIDFDQDDPAARQRAHMQIYTALREGRLRRQPCVVCHADTNVVCHHADYGKPLDVVFLCRSHHHRFHVYLRRRLDELGYPEYTKAFHDQALVELKRDYLEPSLFAKPKKPFHNKFKRPYISRFAPDPDKYQLRTIETVAGLIGQPESFVRDLIDRGEITYYAFGKRYKDHRISIPDLATWLEETGEVKLTTDPALAAERAKESDH